jgi:hypothetical protein
MTDSVTIALLASGPVFLFSCLNLLVAYKQNIRIANSNNYKDIITKRRIEWIDTIRSEIAEFIGLISVFQTYMYVDLDKIKTEIIEGKGTGESKTILPMVDRNSKLLITSNKLILRLNPKDDIELIATIKGITAKLLDGQTDKKYVDSEIEHLIVQTHQMLKNEWEKVKKESGKNIE